MATSNSFYENIRRKSVFRNSGRHSQVARPQANTPECDHRLFNNSQASAIFPG
jgi:hypothetical protein